jgi:tartrate-resistant acid phosphatase type 5
MIASVVVSILLLSSGPGAMAQNDHDAGVRFLIVSDEGGRASDSQKAVAVAMGKEAERIDAQFVLTAGDNFHQDGIASSKEKRWNLEFEEVYSARALQIPWFPSLGNHDYRGNVDGEIEYSRFSARWKMPSRYYAQTIPIDDSSALLIVHLDTSPFIDKYRTESSVYHMDGQSTSEQLRWLDSVLTVSTARWKLVIGHHAIYYAEPGKNDSNEMIEKVLPILKAHGIPLYVSGHYHFFQHITRGGMDFVICGGGAETGDVAERNDVVYGIRSLGFLSVSVGAKKMQVRFISVDNAMLHTIEIVQEGIR